MENNNDAWIGDRRVVITVKSVELKTILLGPGTGQKLIITAESDNPRFQCIDECWVKQEKNVYKNKGLWVYFENEDTRKLSPSSNVAKLLIFSRLQNTQSLVGKELTGILKPNGFLALLIAPYEEEATYL